MPRQRGDDDKNEHQDDRRKRQKQCSQLCAVRMRVRLDNFEHAVNVNRSLEELRKSEKPPLGGFLGDWSRRRGLNPWPFPYQGNALPLSYDGIIAPDAGTSINASVPT